MMLQLCSAAGAAFLLASLLLWVRTLRRLAAGEAILPWESVRPATWGLLDLILIAALLVASQAYAVEWVRSRFGLAIGVAFEKWGLEARAQLQLAVSLATLLVVAGSILWLTGRYRVRAADLGVAPREFSNDLRRGSVAFLLLGPVIYGIQSILVQFFVSKHPLLELLKENPDPRFFALTGFSAVVVAPVCEEYFFRVLLQGWLERLAAPGADAVGVLWGGRPATPRATPSDALVSTRESGHGAGECSHANGLSKDPWGDPRPGVSAGSETLAEREETRAERDAECGVENARDPCSAAEPRPLWPVLASSLLFALMHWSHGPDPIPLFFLALALGGIYQRTQRVLPCIVAHALLNATSLAMLYVTVHLQ